MKRRRRIYSELLPLDELGTDATLDALRTHELELVAAIWPHTVDETLAIARRAQARGIAVTLWPMLADGDGRWANIHNVEAFDRFVRALVEMGGDVVRELLIDLEPPIARMRSFLDGNFDLLDKQRSHRRFLDGKRGLRRLMTWLGKRDIKTTAAVIPLVVYDRPGKTGWQWLLGTPVDGLPFDSIHIMAYTTLFEGYTRGLLGRKDALALLDELSVAAAARFGARAGISIGCTGPGALGDEASYRELAELHVDLERVAASGVDDIALFDLRGVLRRADAPAWLAALAAPAPHVSRAPTPRLPSRRARLLAWLFAQRFAWFDDDLTEDLLDDASDG